MYDGYPNNRLGDVLFKAYGFFPSYRRDAVLFKAYGSQSEDLGLIFSSTQTKDFINYLYSQDPYLMLNTKEIVCRKCRLSILNFCVVRVMVFLHFYAVDRCWARADFHPLDHRVTEEWPTVLEFIRVIKKRDHLLASKYFAFEIVNPLVNEKLNQLAFKSFLKLRLFRRFSALVPTNHAKVHASN